ncbi:hypothetical protein GJAV_G00082300 [Gymnothorax javanicus]|nr:hypothetical protein GJAV_G00082300 [Gymnothorax javanicus]
MFDFWNKECPTGRKKLVSKRSLGPDPNFDTLIDRGGRSSRWRAAVELRITVTAPTAVTPPSTAAMRQGPAPSTLRPRMTLAGIWTPLQRTARETWRWAVSARSS